MKSIPMNDRNNALKFARRARKNLHAIDEIAAQDPERVHWVTQLVLSLLGLPVFPKEQLLLEKTKGKLLAEIADDVWPRWTITRDQGKPTRTLDDVLTHLRKPANCPA